MGKLNTYSIERAKGLRVPPEPGKPYSLPVPGSQVPGRSAVYRHWRFTDALLETMDPKIRTAHDFFEEAVANVPKNKCLGHRPWDPLTKTWGAYVWEDYETIATRRKNLGSGLRIIHENIGVTGKYGVGLWCNNRPEFQITDLAAHSQSLFTVSLYDTLGPQTTEYIINHAELSCVATSLSHIPTLLKIAPRCPSLKIIICMDPLSAGEVKGESKRELLNQFAKEAGVQILEFTEVEKLGAASPRPINPPTPEDIVTINYTSGTTGDPKGVVLTHKNTVAATSSTLCLMDQTDEDVSCSFLPLAHIYERLAEHLALWGGAGIGFYHGDVNEVVEDLKLLRPTGFSGVPRLFNRIGAGIRLATIEKPANPIRGALSKYVINLKLEKANNPDPKIATNRHWLWDKVWAKKVAANVGLQRCHTIISGSAPLDPSLHQFLRVCFANNFSQGYGLTETYAMALCQVDGDMTTGNCGGVGPSGEICLRDVPDMEYLSTDKPFPRGELLIRGNTIFREYHKNAAETAKALDNDGWFATGDICQVDDMGRFSIIDRVKNLLKLSQGEYVSPERIENVYLANLSFLQTAYIHGDSDKTSLVGLFGVEPEAFAEFAGRAMGKRFTKDDISEIEAACKDERVLKAAQKQLDRISKENKFNRYEWCRAHHLFLTPFTEEKNLMTPTMKLKRSFVAKHYRSNLDALYEAVAANEKPIRALL
ncbi:long-chain-fatty-acid-CoA ligase/ protein binding protein [Microthyrium microscopicum]|uniref:Long-chain-fatty-acid-CoA ligase/ protein binding protein n=1 Tax=Microthyrium microscopicum TaxID=703497 RepID=A0A6A6UJM1_9PEZI|nr:long-chain-fatty-acid-CoA ligase/ protein binding protein [Microthyrium microscopicum]